MVCRIACGDGDERPVVVAVPLGAASGRELLPGSASTWPTAKGSKAVSSTIKVSGAYDGKLKRFYGAGELGGSGQEEGQDPVFELADGAVLKNVIIGTPGADGVHCKGSCTLQNVWWLDVSENAAASRGSRRRPSTRSPAAAYGTTPTRCSSSTTPAS